MCFGCRAVSTLEFVLFFLHVIIYVLFVQFYFYPILVPPYTILFFDRLCCVSCQLWIVGSDRDTRSILLSVSCEIK